jgi:hypothetical protein
MKRKTLITFGCIVGVFFLLAGLGFHWTINRIYVDEGESLMLRYKGPLIFGSRNKAETGMWAKEGQMGVLANLRGSGRHFYCPVWWERTKVQDIVIKPGSVGMVTCKLGADLPSGEYLVDGSIGETKHKGILRNLLAPGRYRINPYGYTVKIVTLQEFESGKQRKVAGWVSIPTGYVGVVTNLAENKTAGTIKGVQDNVLPPGLYPINGREQNIDIVEIGYRHSTIQMDVKRDENGVVQIDEKSGEPIIDNIKSGIEFPSSDGFAMHIDFTAIWGLMPDQAAHAIRTIGNVDSVEEKIVLPQVESICRNNGSEFKAVQLLVGSEREVFQKSTLEEFHTVLDEKQITLLYGLVRHVYVPKQVREPIQQSFIADENTLTRMQEQKTAKEEGSLREAEEGVTLATATVEVESLKLVAARKAAGNREAEGTRADTSRQVAAIEKETEELKAQAIEILGKAENDGKLMIEEAKSDRFRLAVEAFGTPQAYNNWYFATNLPDDVELKLLYAGQGTLWTDMSKAGGGFGIRANIPLDNGSKKK